MGQLEGYIDMLKDEVFKIRQAYDRFQNKQSE